MRLLPLAFAALLAMLGSGANAQTYPSRPVKLVVFFPAGGVGDIMARIMAQWLGERMGQGFVVENRPGAGGTVGTETVVRAAPDGYTLLWATSPNAINASFYPKLSYDFARDIAPVAATFRVPNVMVMNPALLPRTVDEFIAYARSMPGKLNLATGGNGVPSHIAGELFKMMTGVEMATVHYRGAAPALNDLVAGHVHVLFDAMPSSIEHIRAGRVRALAVTTAERSAALPDLPTVAAVLPGFEASTWFGVGAPRETAPEIVARLNAEINAGLADPKLAARITELGGTTLPGTPGDFARLIAEEIEKWAKVVRFSGAKPD